MRKAKIIILTIGLMLFCLSQVAAETILFQDDFGDGDNVGWTTTVGDWTVISQQNEVTGTTSMLGTQMAYTYAGDFTWTDYTFDVDITFGTGDTEFYVAVRVDPTSFPTPGGGRQYYLSVDGDNDIVRLRYTSSDPDDFVTVRSVSYTLFEQTTYHLQIVMSDNTIEAYIDGDTLFSYTFSGSEPIYVMGLIGIGYKSDEGPDGAYFDNVLVTTELEPPPPQPDLQGCINLQDTGLNAFEVRLEQRDEDTQTTTTDADGCYQFQTINKEKDFTVNIEGQILFD